MPPSSGTRVKYSKGSRPHPDSDHSAWIRYIAELKGDSAVRDIQSLPDNGHLYAAHVINDIWKETHGEAIVVPTSANIRCGKRSITPQSSRR